MKSWLKKLISLFWHRPDKPVKEQVGSEGWRLDIACDADGRPHIVADVHGAPLTIFYDWTGRKWRKTRYNSGGKTPQAYNPCQAITGRYQYVTVVKWWEDGMGLMIRKDFGKVRKYTPTRGGMFPGTLPVGLCAANGMDIVVYAGNGGYWQQYNHDLNTTTSGIMQCGSGGEKNGFDIAGNVWHACSDYSYRNDKMGGPENWLDFDTYSKYTDYDECYPAVVGDLRDNTIAYIAIDFTRFGGPGIMMQIWHKDTFVLNLDNLLCVTPTGTSGEARYAPQLCADPNGGCYLACQEDDKVAVMHVSQGGGVERITAFAGTRPTITCSKGGKVYVAYFNGGIQCKRVRQGRN